MSKLYYTLPADNHFREVKEKASEIWNTYDNQYGYADEKLDAISNLKNVGDNFMYIVAMFDIFNQRKLAGILSNETRNEIAIRIKDGGMEDIDNPFL